MTEEQITQPTENDATQVPAAEPAEATGDAPVEEPVAEAAVAPADKPMAIVRDSRVRGGRGSRFGGPGGRGRGPMRGRGPSDLPESEYEEKNLEIARVTRVTKGGKRMRFRALTVIGNHKGRVGFGIAKAVDVQGATSKATAQARKALITVPISDETIPHPVEAKFAAARVLLKPAPKGTGVKAGGAVRVVLALAGIPNVTSKILGSANKINNVKATFKALRMLKAPAKDVETTDNAV
ncbi:30S ribosomal protein S5 [Candidatus Uhrbacteria bacterium]|nr:30S ribosomal protein S5 [Candidatus Uhrbacteria bacterium]